MRMSDLIEDCEDDLEFGVDADLEEGKTISVVKPPCPDGMHRDESGKCVKISNLEMMKMKRKKEKERRSALRSNASARNVASDNKRIPSLVDRMKSLFGKK